MKTHSVALLLFGESNSPRDVFSEDRYKDLAVALAAEGFNVKAVSYNDSFTQQVYEELLHIEVILVWVNPVEQGRDRKQLDEMLLQLASKGCIVSTHPAIILKMGTKDILYKTRDMDFGGPVNLYSSVDDFKKRFPASLRQSGVKIVKQYRGNGGNGVFKIALSDATNHHITVTHAKGDDQVTYTEEEFFEAFKTYFSNGGLLIEQEWNTHHVNGMVRCYLSGNQVAGFGYQEINALYEISTPSGVLHLPPGKRYYYTENCGLFADLKTIMETSWVPGLQERLDIPSAMLPVIWDADFFINEPNHPTPVGKYSLCEINVSSVSPFPPSAVPYMVKEVRRRIVTRQS